MLFHSAFILNKVRGISASKCHFLNSLHLIKVWSRPVSSEIRNIGIMAHIDAGKTTTTERILYYAGYIMRMGDIDAGDTVMDYLPTERERGITIQSAAISFNWLNTHVNLIDTPGHVDFTIEVERSLRVLDGAVAIFDAAKGVEAQSRTVWRQADRHNIPRVAFINKMDKPGSSLAACIHCLKSQLRANTALLQSGGRKFYGNPKSLRCKPVKLEKKWSTSLEEGYLVYRRGSRQMNYLSLCVLLPVMQDDRFCGIIDIVGLEKSIWDVADQRSNRSGRPFATKQLDSSDQYWESCIEARETVVEQLCEHYDDVAMTWLEGDNAGDVTSIKPSLLRQWLRRATIDRTIVPVFCGSSLKNIAVQPLLDAVVHYLPKPSDIRHDFTQFYQNSLAAMAFKVVINKRLGPLIFVRVYSGKLKNGMTIYNVNKSCCEKVTRLMNVFADDFRNIPELRAGMIGLVSGLSSTITGDTLVESEKTFEIATSLALKSSNDDAIDTEHSQAVLAAVPVHEPVFFCTVEVQSITQEKALSEALQVISREDPSVRVEYLDNGTIVLSGMGELHMDIVVERIRKDFKVDAYIGPLQVAYREVPTEAAKCEERYERTVLGKDHHVFVRISVRPCSGLSTPRKVSDVVSSMVYSLSKQAAAQGIVQACQKGLILGYPVMDSSFKLHAVKTSDGCPPALVTAAAFKCAQGVLNLAQCQLVEPMMNLQVNTVSSAYDNTVQLLHKHHAEIQDFTTDEDYRIVSAQAPVASMKGFSSSLRSATSGLADFTVEMAGYQPVSEERLLRIKDELSGVVT